ncbi:MAG: hypothetical protein AB1758_08700 [Candidatus Eremiobacterota bacterium]
MLVVLAGLACVGGGYFLYKKASQYVTFDSTRVEEMAGEILPGAAAPDGYSGFMGVNLKDVQDEDLRGMRIAALTPTSNRGADEPGQLMILLMEIPHTDGDFDVEAARKQFQQASSQDSSEGEVLSKETITVQAGGHDLEGDKAVKKEDGKNVVEMTFVFKGRDNQMIFLIMGGPEQGFNEALVEEFLSKLDYSALKEVDPSVLETGKVEEEPVVGQPTDEAPTDEATGAEPGADQTPGNE